MGGEKTKVKETTLDVSILNGVTKSSDNDFKSVAKGFYPGLESTETNSKGKSSEENKLKTSVGAEAHALLIGGGGSISLESQKVKSPGNWQKYVDEYNSEKSSPSSKPTVKAGAAKTSLSTVTTYQGH